MGEMKKRTKALVRNLRDDSRTLGDSVDDGLKAADMLETLAAKCDEQTEEIAQLKAKLARYGIEHK